MVKKEKTPIKQEDPKDLVSNEVNIVFIGDEGVGKTSIINNYAHDTF